MSEEINYKKFIPLGIQTLLAIPSLYDLMMIFMFPEKWFYNQMKKKDNTIITVCIIFLTIRLLKKYFIYYLLFNLIFFIITFMLCKNQYTITSYLVACIVCSIQGFYSFFYNTIIDTVNNSSNIKDMNKKLDELNKDEFKKYFINNKSLNPQQRSIINIISDGKESAKKEDYSQIIKLLYNAEKEIKNEVKFD